MGHRGSEPLRWVTQICSPPSALVSCVLAGFFCYYIVLIFNFGELYNQFPLVTNSLTQTIKSTSTTVNPLPHLFPTSPSTGNPTPVTPKPRMIKSPVPSHRPCPATVLPLILRHHVASLLSCSPALFHLNVPFMLAAVLFLPPPRDRIHGPRKLPSPSLILNSPNSGCSWDAKPSSAAASASSAATIGPFFAILLFHRLLLPRLGTTPPCTRVAT